MKREWIENFLLKTSIPGKKASGEEAMGERLRDAVFRAHRDVLSGRFWLENYCAKKSGNEENDVVKRLYDIMLEKHEKGEPLASKPLIDPLCKQFEDVEFGAIQKLVNMTLKYIIVLKTMCPDFSIELDESGCDCPLDSTILGKLPNQHAPWTRMDSTEYSDVQKEIKEQLGKSGYVDCGNIVFDFLNW